jgi:hypothetical protein
MPRALTRRCSASQMKNYNFTVQSIDKNNDGVIKCECLLLWPNAPAAAQSMSSWP